MTSSSDQERIYHLRLFLKDKMRETTDFSATAQSQGLPPPPLQKPYDESESRITLPAGENSMKKCCSMTLADAITMRRSSRSFSHELMTQEELSALLWSSQGVKRATSNACAFRTVPSAGARHAFETYLCIQKVEGIKAGLYRYLPFSEELLLIKEDEEIARKAAVACLNQNFVAKAAATFFWTVIPERMEWRYSTAAHKVLALDAGHVCQNLYLACTAMGAGTCAIAAYDQQACDDLLGVDGEDEFTIYVAPTGKTK